MSTQKSVSSFDVYRSDADVIPFVVAEDAGGITRGSFCLPSNTAAATYLRSLGTGVPTLAEVPTVEPIGPHDGSECPFLTVVIRTQGKRIEELTDVLLCLAGQQDDDFEILVVGHRVTAEDTDELKRLLCSFSPTLTCRMRYCAVDYGSRTTPLRVGFWAARGRYVAVLDDDDLVMDTWTASFKQLAKDNDGKMLHTYVVTQKWGTRSLPQINHRELYAEDGFGIEYCHAFSVSSQLSVNSCPLMGLAFPRFAFASLGIDFDESLTTTEDWDFLMRVYAACGVASGNDVTSIYRLWTNAACSHTMHTTQEWDYNYKKIVGKFNERPYLLDIGGVEDVRLHNAQSIVSRETLVQEALLGAYHTVPIKPDYWKDVTLMRAGKMKDPTIHCIRASLGEENWDISFVCDGTTQISTLVFAPIKAPFKVLGEFELHAVEASGEEFVLDFSNCVGHNGYQVDCNHIVYLKESPFVAFDLPEPMALQRVDLSFKLIATVADYYVDQVTLGERGLKLGRAKRWLKRKIGRNG